MTVKRQRASEQVTEEVTAWPGVTAGPGPRGEFAFRVGAREIGHLHGNHAAHFVLRRSSGASCVRVAESKRIRSFPARRGRARGASRTTPTFAPWSN